MEIDRVKMPAWMRGLSVVFGIIAIGGSLLVLADPALGVSLLIVLLSIGLLFMGVDRLMVGLSGRVTVMKLAEKAQMRSDTA